MFVVVGTTMDAHCLGNEVFVWVPELWVIVDLRSFVLHVEDHVGLVDGSSRCLRLLTLTSTFLHRPFHVTCDDGLRLDELPIFVIGLPSSIWSLDIALVMETVVKVEFLDGFLNVHCVHDLVTRLPILIKRRVGHEFGFVFRGVIPCFV